MLNQIVGGLFGYLLTYLPNLLGIILYAVLLVFAILIYKRNSYNYGITLMISSIILLASDIIYMSIQYPYLANRLLEELPVDVVMLTLLAWNFVFLSLYTISTIFLVVSIYLIYKTHKKDRID